MFVLEGRRASVEAERRFPAAERGAERYELLTAEEHHQQARHRSRARRRKAVCCGSRFDRQALSVGLAWRASWGRAYWLMRRNGFGRPDRPVQPERPARREETRCNTVGSLTCIKYVYVSQDSDISGKSHTIRFDNGVDRLRYLCAHGNKRKAELDDAR